jgi:hypothetical protein
MIKKRSIVTEDKKKAVKVVHVYKRHAKFREPDSLGELAKKCIFCDCY